MTANELRKGMVIYYDDDMFVILETHHLTPGNKRGYTQVKMRNLKKGTMYAHKFRSTDDVERAFLESRKMEYLYPDDGGFVFMDTENYEQVTLGADLVGEQMKFVKLNEHVKVTFHEGTPIEVDLPASVVLAVTETEPGFRGDTATNVTKPATLETEYELRVPPYIKEGEKVRVDTRTGAFLERVNE